MRSEVLMVVKMLMLVFCVVTSCGIVVDPNISEEHSASAFRVEVFLQDYGTYLQVHTTLQPRRQILKVLQ
jgi:hypothetical protein